MTTSGLDEIDELRNRIRESANNVRERAAKLLKVEQRIQQDAQRDAEDAAVAARVLRQQHQDDLKLAQEESRQLHVILGKDYVAHPLGEPQPTAPVPPAPGQPPADDGPFGPNGPRWDPPRATPPVATTAPQPRATDRNSLNPRNWHALVLAAAIIALLLAALGLWLSCDFVVWDLKSLAKEVVANILTDGGILALSFYGVGLIGDLIFRGNRQNRRNH